VNTDAPKATTMSLVQRVAGIVLIFALVGPPVGGLVLLIGRLIAATLLRTTPASEGWLETAGAALIGIFALAFAAIAGAPYSYLYGIAPAAVAGLVIGILRVKYGRLSPSLVLVVGGLTGAIYTVALSRLVTVTSWPINLLLSGFSTADSVLYILSCMLATLACWRFARTFPA